MDNTQSDLEGLEITPGEIKHWSGINQKLLYRPATVKKLLGEGLKTFFILLLLLISYWVWSLIFPELSLILIIIYLIMGGLLILEDSVKLWNTLTRPQFVKLCHQVERYNAIVKALKIYDQLDAIAHPPGKLNNREAIIAALNLIRTELIKGLKIERTLKNYQKFIQQHSELFDPNFTALTVLQTEKPTTEQGRLLYQAFEIASDVHQQLKQLQEQQISR
ncbi:hypothetical protein [Planktothrix mougeotii]|uniref:5-bromo-4-chloroindolyl phosphate hydrolysis protein n=1 Tax=Planktothrix mougeotii LEGE 06226 TaxID=1828728 RepID=A0ABR9U9L4_9CYAN|nr:hypothetical protein [Planktothrix mougeotii]MBE9142319.1 hypothetical protein [Planktothrix mougeotii LEGE 06226]